MSESELSEYEITATRTSPQRMTVDTGEETFETGGDVTPVEYLLGSLLGCLNATATMVAQDMEIDIDELDVTVESGIDYGRFQDGETEARAGFQDLDVTMSVAADADEAELSEWLAAVEKRCPVTDNVRNETPVEISLDTQS